MASLAARCLAAASVETRDCDGGCARKIAAAATAASVTLICVRSIIISLESANPKADVLVEENKAAYIWKSDR
jgi:hypothetical protein